MCLQKLAIVEVKRVHKKYTLISCGGQDGELQEYSQNCGVGWTHVDTRKKGRLDVVGS
jgi:hypothetical protein